MLIVTSKLSLSLGNTGGKILIILGYLDIKGFFLNRPPNF